MSQPNLQTTRQTTAERSSSRTNFWELRGECSIVHKSAWNLLTLQASKAFGSRGVAEGEDSYRECVDHVQIPHQRV